MASKRIRDGFIDSEAVNALHSWMAESVYHRMLLKADSAGRFDGRPGVIARQLYPLKPQIVHTEIERQLSDIASVGLVIRYAYAGRPYIQLTKVRIYDKDAQAKYPWTDGSKTIKSVVLNTEEGPREFVATSIADSSKPVIFEAPDLSRPRVVKMLDTVAFWNAWDSWVGNWVEKGQPLTSAQKDEHIRQLAHSETVEVAIATLGNSIEVAIKYPKLYPKWQSKIVSQQAREPNKEPNRRLAP